VREFPLETGEGPITCSSSTASPAARLPGLKCYNPKNRFDRQETAQFRAFTYDELMQRDKVSLDIFWLKDESLEDMENLPDPDVLAAEIVENLQAALEQFRGILEDLGGD